MNQQYQLCFYSGSLTGKTFPIVKEETKIGRDASCDIVLAENSVSRVHVYLYIQQNGAVVLVDNNSTNGTVVNNYQISAPVQLSENDVIGLGGEVMMVFQTASGYEPGGMWNSTEMPAGNAPDSYNFEKKQGSPMSNDNNNYPNDGANGYPVNAGMDQQPSPDNYGFNQAYSMNMNNSQYPVGQVPYSFTPLNQFTQYPMGNMPGNPMPVQPPVGDSTFSGPISNPNLGGVSGAVNAAEEKVDQAVNAAESISQFPQQAAAAVNSFTQPVSQQPVPDSNPISQQPMNQMPYGNNMYGQPPMGQMPYGNDPYSQQPMNQMPYGNNMYGQPPMGQMPYGNNPYGQPPMSQMPYGNDPYSQQPMGQMSFGNGAYSQQPSDTAAASFNSDPYSQQPGTQQASFGSDPYSQQPGTQQMPYGADPYAQTMPYGSDPYSQQMGQQMPYGADPYAQATPYGSDPYSQQMGQQMPYGNNPYGQQMGQMPYGNNPYGQPMGQQNPYAANPYGQQQYAGAVQQPAQEEETPKKGHKKLFIILGIVLLVLILIGVFILYIDTNRLWCDVLPFLFDEDVCLNYVR